MSIDIAITHFYQTALRKADRDTSIHKGDSDPALADERIDTPAEADAALTNILTGMEISKAPQFYQALLRKEVDRKEGVKRTDPSHAFNDTIDADEVAWAKQVLLAGRTRQEVLSAFVFYTPEIPQGFLSCEAPKQIFSIPYISTASIKKGRYGEAAVRLAKFFFDHDGDPPNAIHSFKVYDKEMIAAYGAYHVYEDDATHIGNGGAGTSEGQVLFFNFMTLYAALSGDKRGMEGAYNYIRYFMMPHDGKSSRQLPDYMLGSKDPRWNPYLIHWLIDISGVTFFWAQCYI
ncbi:MAG: hypothetical protein NT099_03135 [Candidatus Saganbacteria bacterium]|nr:hypothetical protein [Candidatus Saganbacteria bacterium]